MNLPYTLFISGAIVIHTSLILRYYPVPDSLRLVLIGLSVVGLVVVFMFGKDVAEVKEVRE